MNGERKVVVVTGASHGIGEAFVKTYRDRGWLAVGNARTIAPSNDPDYITVPGDIGDPTDRTEIGPNCHRSLWSCRHRS